MNIVTSNVRQFIVTHKMLAAVERGFEGDLDVVAGISGHFSKSGFVLFCCMTNHLMTGPLRNSEFCFPQILKHGDSQETKFTSSSGPDIKC